MVSPPITPSEQWLPLNADNWSWERFEAFCLELIAQFGEVKDCYRYGVQGDFQRGIDIVAHLASGERWVFQCKRYKKWTETQTQQAVKKVSYNADRYFLLLSCKASRKVRDEVNKHATWEAWDVEDISIQVRKLEPDIARRLVGTHFSAEWRRAFLGLAGLITFVAPTDFFRRSLNPQNLFNHLWSLVGRETFIQELHDFVASEGQRVAILPGRGGIGKSKLLHHFAEEFESYHPELVLRFWQQDVEITKASLDELPLKACVIVVDDAHRCSSLSNLLAFIQQQHSQSIKLILSSRLQGIDHLFSCLTQSGFDTTSQEAAS